MDSGWGTIDEWPVDDTTTATTTNGTSTTAPPQVPTPPPEVKLPKTRGYQQEMLDESIHKNIVIALDTGAGKTHIAVLRMKHEVERETTKVCWFLTPTVALCYQQRSVVQSHLHVPVAMISGALEPDQWKDPNLWSRVLATHRIVVSTHDVLLNALRHGYIHLGCHISLIVFDEAHHAADKHPYNRIMQEFYFDLPKVDVGDGNIRPRVLGLTASPVFGGDIERAFLKLEANLDCTIRAPVVNRSELATHVHRPEFKHVLYEEPTYMMGYGPAPSSNVQSLQSVVESLDINEDPYVLSLRAELARVPPGAERTRTDQRLSKTIHKQDSYTHKGMRDFLRAADEICSDLGEWAADWYVHTVLEQAWGTMKGSVPEFVGVLSSKEKQYLMGALARVQATPVSYHPDEIVRRSSDKVKQLVQTLLTEKEFFESHGEEYHGLIFVTRRDAVIALSEILENHPETKHVFRTGALLGMSENSARKAFLDITRAILKQSNEDTLRDFKVGDLNLIVATAVAEEGLDVQACNNVVRWDPPMNMVSWAQSRGRARRQRSSFVLMFSSASVHARDVEEWERLEHEMVRLYNMERQRLDQNPNDDDDGDGAEIGVEPLYNPKTGAKITLDSAVTHLNHFCSILPGSGGMSFHSPIYDISPPDYPSEWHAQLSALLPYPGPFGATVTLPKLLDPQFRVFSTPIIHKRKSYARRRVAFEAYKALYKKGLLNDHLLPLMSVLEPKLEDEVKKLLSEVDKRDGVTRVTKQLDPWNLESGQEPACWYSTELVIHGLPTLRMFTLTKVCVLQENDMPLLYTHDGSLVPVHVIPSNTPILPMDSSISQARDFTRMLLLPLYGNRMTESDINFAYLFLPSDFASPAWNTQLWAKRRATYNTEPKPYGLNFPLLARADWFGEHYNYPQDIGMVGEMRKYGRAYRFIRWKSTPVTEEEAADLAARYAPEDEELEITYPLIVAKPLPSRVNFLVPLPQDSKAASATNRSTVLLLPEFSTVALAAFAETQYALWMPSILRYLSITMTVYAMRDTLFSDSPRLSAIPLKLLTTAVTSGVAQTGTNYQRLETLGDTVLKFITSLNLLSEYPLWHEGYLARRKDHAVSNAQLAKAAYGKKLFKYIIRDMFAPRKWKPTYIGATKIDPIPEAQQEEEAMSTETRTPQQGPSEAKKRQRAKVQGEISTKVLADVVESLIGAAYIHGSFDLAVECIKIFGLGLSCEWLPIPARIEPMLSRVIELEFIPTQLSAVENILGYTFQRKALLVEALTHASYQTDLGTISYERMEFLGDAVLDMLVTDYLYHAPGKDYKPGELHLRKTAVVNGHFLGFICLRASTYVSTEMPTKVTNTNVNGRRRGPGFSVQLQQQQERLFLSKCLLHSNSRVLEQQSNAFARFDKPNGGQYIERSLREDPVFPWAALTWLEAPKFLSDMVESLIGAVFLDSEGNWDIVRGVLRILGIWEVLERIVRDDVEVKHPVSRLADWAAKQEKETGIETEVKYVIEQGNGRILCRVLVNDMEMSCKDEIWQGKISRENVRFAAAEETIEALQLDELERREIEAELEAADDGQEPPYED